MLPIPPNLPNTLAQHWEVQNEILRLDEIDQAHIFRLRGKTDLYFLLRHILSTRNWIHPENPDMHLFDQKFFFDRCREVQFGGDPHIDIWSRGSGKSTIKTFGRSFLRVINNVNRTFGIFSVNAKLAQQFLRMIMVECEENEFLVNLFPDVFWKDPEKESASWSVGGGLVLRRTMNLKDPTFAAYGLIDSSFTGARMTDRIYDDILNEKYVNTPEMNQKVIDQWDLSTDTGMPGTVDSYAGTFYSYGDAYHEIASRGVPIRLRPCYEINLEESLFDDAGLPLKLQYHEDKPEPFSGEYYESKKKEKSPRIYGAQYLCNPVYASKQSFELDWLQYYDTDPFEEARGKNVYILCDPASSRSKGRSYCVFWVVAVGGDQNYYVVDGIWDRIDLSQRVDHLFNLHDRWKPLEVRYEHYAFQSDIPHIHYVQKHRQYRFQITEVAGNVPKADRISRLQPLFRNRRIFFPKTMPFFCIERGEEVDLVEVFKTSEYLPWPETSRDDMLDALSRIAEPDLPVMFPKGIIGQNPVQDRYWRGRQKQKNQRPPRSWMSV